jgi:hypothetical protein
MRIGRRRGPARCRVLYVAQRVAAFAFAALTATSGPREAVVFQRLTPRPPVVRTSDFRLAAAQTLPEVESYPQVVFSGSVSSHQPD